MLPQIDPVLILLVLTLGGAEADLTTSLDHQLCLDQCVLQDTVGVMDATLMNGATCTPGEGIVFDGEDDYVDLADQSLGGPMTIAFWARRDGQPTSNNWLCNFGNGRQNNIIAVGDGVFVIYDGDGHEYLKATDGGSSVFGAWTHWVATVQGTTMKIYQDGILVKNRETGDAHEPVSLTRADHWLGITYAYSGYYHKRYFQGVIKSMQIWSRALDAGEVASLDALGGACLIMPPSPAPTSAAVVSAAAGRASARFAFAVVSVVVLAALLERG